MADYAAGGGKGSRPVVKVAASLAHSLLRSSQHCFNCPLSARSLRLWQRRWAVGLAGAQRFEGQLFVVVQASETLVLDVEQELAVAVATSPSASPVEPSEVALAIGKRPEVFFIHSPEHVGVVNLQQVGAILEHPRNCPAIACVSLGQPLEVGLTRGQVRLA